MGERLRVRGVRSIVSGGTAVVVLTSVLIASAAGSGPVLSGNAATVGSSASASSISATVYVSAIGCAAVPRGVYEGQRAGVQLLGSYRRGGATVHPLDFAGYYSYCHGKVPSFRAEFMISNPSTGLLTFRPAGLAIAPGDPLKVSVTRTDSGVKLKITDVNTKRSRTLAAPPLGGNAGWSSGALELFGAQNGRPLLKGSVLLEQPYSPSGGPNAIPGPVPWAPIIFTHLKVDGHIVGASTKGLHLTTWRVSLASASGGSASASGGSASASGGSAPASGGSTGASRGSTGASRGSARPAAASAAAGRPASKGTAAGNTPTNATVTPPKNGTFESNDGGLPPPTLGKSVDLTPVTGDVSVQTPGKTTFKHVPKGVLIPNGSTIDASHGSVQMTLALPHGNYETGVFYDGQFQLSQDGKSGATTATLTGNGLADCPKLDGDGDYDNDFLGASTARAHASGTSPAGAAPSRASDAKAGPGVATVAKAKTKPQKVRSLWANAHGNFTTKGSGGAAAVLGTKWFTRDTCAGTYFKVIRDKIQVTVYYPHPHTVVVTAGHSLFAPSRWAIYRNQS
jgi:hypothetical protein